LHYEALALTLLALLTSLGSIQISRAMWNIKAPCQQNTIYSYTRKQTNKR